MQKNRVTSDPGRPWADPTAEVNCADVATLAADLLVREPYKEDRVTPIKWSGRRGYMDESAKRQQVRRVFVDRILLVSPYLHATRLRSWVDK